MDIIFIKGLKINAKIGIHVWERHVEQTLLIDLELKVEMAKVAMSDTIAATLNYATVIERLKAFIATQQFQLLETLAEALAQLIKAEFAVASLRLTIGKPSAFADIALVGVTIER